MKTYFKTIARLFQKHLMRFFSIIFIVLVSVGLISGVGSSAEVIDNSLSRHYERQNVSDLIVKSTSQEGFSDDAVATLRARYGAQNVQSGMSLDVKLPIDGQERAVRLFFLDFSDWTVNTLIPVSGKTPQELAGAENVAISVAAPDTERAETALSQLEEGQTFLLDFESLLRQTAEQADREIDSNIELLFRYLESVEITVKGIAESPIAFAKEGEPSYIQEEGTVIPEVANALGSLNTVEYIFYLPWNTIPTCDDILKKIGLPDSMLDAMLEQYGYTREDTLLPRGDLYVALSDRDCFDSFSSEYADYLETEKAFIERRLGENTESITLEDNYSFHSLHAYADKVLWLSIILMVAFVFVTALVVLSNMTRLMEEERAQIACLRTLGYSGFKTMSKYLLFAMVAMGIGGVLSYLVGVGLSAFIYEVFHYNYFMPVMVSVASPLFFLAAFCSIVGITLLATLFSGIRMTDEKPATLLRPKPPKSGKKVILERIPVIWNRLSFKYKSTMRNVLRYMSRFIMTVVSVACSMGLVLAGLALLDLCLFQNFGSTAIIGLSVVIVVFAGLLTMVVIYTLTNINISERNREIATLMVLGYYDREVTSYIYREVYINTFVGIVFGYPMGVFLMWLVFTVMNFGSLATVGWFVWLIAPFVVLLFTGIVTLILRFKIVRIDMNESLKAIE